MLARRAGILALWGDLINAAGAKDDADTLRRESSTTSGAADCTITGARNGTGRTRTAVDFLSSGGGITLVVERRRDPHAAPSALGRPARAAAGSFEAGVAGPCVAGAAGRDAASRAPRRDADHRHSRHDPALASRHRPAPLGTPVAPWPVRAAAGAPPTALIDRSCHRGRPRATMVPRPCRVIIRPRSRRTSMAWRSVW